MAEEKGRKQMRVTDVENKLYVVKSKVAFLESAIMPMHAGADLRLNEEDLTGFGHILRDIHAGIEEIAAAEIVHGTPVQTSERIGSAVKGETRPQIDARTLEKVTTEQYREALSGIQADLQGCLPDLKVLNGYLGEDPIIDPDVELSVRDTVAQTCEAVQGAMKRMENIL